MNSIIALLAFGIALVLTIVLAIALLIVIIVRSNFPDASDGCDYCDSDDATRLGGGEVACSDCRKRNL
ncbi:hypothetical protein [Halorubrum ezzemoulense]|uniref:hypothetical protein n=1 Tax=Halorubrum ezzemoulense TaxID=337243 RepID=UPI00232E4C6A|nr:hypothetical protein [Halorubrum ezzemoulense]MDB2242683.1 hypothetical protein [Halorubrum ezzemoulense]